MKATFFLILLFSFTAHAQTTAFTFQGRISDSGAAQPTNGLYDFRLDLVDVANNPVGATQTLLGIQVTSGVFTVQLDFGSDPFASGSNRYLRIGVKRAGDPAYVTLAPNQQLTSAPFAIQTLNAENLGGRPANEYISVDDARLSDARDPLPNSPNYIRNSTAGQTADFKINGTGTAGFFDTTGEYRFNGARLLALVGTSLFIGQNSAVSTGSNNLFAGAGAGLANTTGSRNTFAGRSSGAANLAGADNAFIGYRSGLVNTSGNSNAFFGADAGMANVIGSNSVYVGYRAGASSLAGGNTFVGALAGQLNTTGSLNAFIGSNAGQANTTGNENVFVGVSAGFNNTIGGQNAFFGTLAGGSNQSAFDNSFFGWSAGTGNITGAGNSFFGSEAGKKSDTVSNSFFGNQSGLNTTSGGSNSFFGWRAGRDNVSGGNNSFVGTLAGSANTTGGNNVFVGLNSGSSNITGSNNTAIGFGAGPANGFTLNFATAIGSGATAIEDNSIALGRLGGADLVQVYGKIRLNTLGAAGAIQLCRNAANEISTCSSSLRYKTSVADYAPGLGSVMRLRPIAFDWKATGVHDLGFGAEDVALVDPLLVTRNDRGEVEGVKYDRITTVLVNAVKEQQAQIQTQSREIEELKSIVCSIKPDAVVCGREK